MHIYSNSVVYDKETYILEVHR